MTLRESLAALSDVREREPMSRHTTLGVGGPADYFVVARDREKLRALARVAREAGAPTFILGSGSNVAVGDAGIRGVVIENRANGVGEPLAVDDSIRLHADAGTSFAKLARSTARQRLSGLEWAAGIPGSLGGAVVYNAGAYGGCLRDVLSAIEVLEPDGRTEAIAAADLGLQYRSSAFTRGLLQDRIILGLTFALQPGDPAEALARIDTLESKRKAAQPRGRTAGSIFKNPPEHPAWWLIDRVGLRGHRIGDAVISEKHANWIVNQGAARAAEVAALMRLAQKRVASEYGIELHAEVALIGEGFA